MVRSSTSTWVCGLAGLISFAASAAASPPESPTMDVHSYGRPTENAVSRVELDLAANFDRKELEGTALLTLKRAGGTNSFPLILDARELSIDRVEAGRDPATLRPVNFDLTTPEPVLGSKLTVWIGPDDQVVRIGYKTAPGAKALQWLEPPQTAGKKKPFLFTQSQAIQARSWIPIQDSPGVRVTYGAKIRVPEGLTAVMSAEALGKSGPGVFGFEMKEPIPPYLIALAVGDLTFKALGGRTGVYAEPATIEKAASEFADTEKMVESVEKRFGPYRWGRYDILVLPPSFPFGGMENPRLTFATPTILAGDRSLVALIAHELAHSWSGNLVTNATWRDFWLNEGVTSYLERRIVEDLYGKERADIERVLGLRDLREELSSLPASDQILHIDLAGRDPDDGVTRVPYDKGALFLATLEEAFGREAFDKFLLEYFNKHAFKSIVTADFVADLKANLLDKNPSAARKIDLDAWIEKPGLPEGFAQPASESLKAVDAQVKGWVDGKTPAKELKTDKWSTQEWVHFLQSLPPKLGKEKMAELDAAFKLTERQNVEIAGQWLLMAIQQDYAPAYPRLAAFLTEIGRRKFIVPLYKELMKTPAGTERAKGIYKGARGGYHPIAVDTLDKVVGKP